MSAEVFDLSASERRVLDLIWHNGPIARRDIAERLQLTAAAVTGLARQLAERRLVVETVDRSGARGQPARPISINQRGAFSVGVNFSHSYVEAGVVDLKGEVVSHRMERISEPDPHIISDVVAAALPKLVGEAGLSLSRCLGAGFTLPGDFLPDGVRLKAHPYFPKFRDIDIRTALKGALALDCYFENDALAAATGEYLLGYGRSCESLVLIHIGHGVGGGVIIKGEAHRGAHGNAALFGVLFPDDRPRPSGMDLFRQLRAVGEGDAVDFCDLEALGPLSDDVTRDWVLRAGEQLERAVYVATRLFDPSVIVIGGRLPGGVSEALLSAIRPERAFGGLEGFAKTGDLPAPSLVASRYGSLAGMVGAASLPLKARLFTQAHGA